MNTDRTLRKEIVDAWNRYVNDTYTLEDLDLIVDSIGDDENLREFYEVLDRVRQEAVANIPVPTAEQRELYRKEAAELLSTYESRRSSFRKRSGRLKRVWYAAAAVVAAAVAIPAAFHYFDAKPREQQYVEAFTTAGETKVVVLSDNTKVTLNAESRLRYPEGFSGGERSVELDGEALFDVASDPKHPFTVQTGSMHVRVLGTVFGVKEYGNDMTSAVCVASGRVEVSLCGGTALLEKDQQVVMDKRTGEFEKSATDAGKNLSWIDGTLYFRRTPLAEVVNMLNRHYPDVRVELAEGEYHNLISGEHDNISVEAVLTSIVYTTGLKCKRSTNNTYILYNP